MVDDKEKLITLSELARRLRVPATWLKDEADAGRLPHVAAGSQRLFNLAVVEDLLAKRAAGLPAEEAFR